METGKTKIKLMLHAMGWEIDYLLNYFTQLKKSKYYLPKNVEVTINVTLNLSDYFINWELSKLPKEFFINKFEHIKPLLIDYKLESKIIHTGVYGHLNAQRDAIDNETEYYILSTPDIIFDEKLLAYYCEAIKSIPNEYFLITPQISKMWDSSWDILVDPLYYNVPYEHYIEQDNFDIIHNQNNSTQEIKLKPLPSSKYAAWFDICNKKFYEELAPVWNEWEGYGGWDYYSMLVSDSYRRMGGDFQQYLLEGQTIIEWTTGHLKNNLTDSYKDYLSFHITPNRGEIFKDNVHDYVLKRINEFGKSK
jgi:hypothetical protein